jgi:uncharacterized membrane protein YkvA (DUF1232 family)
MKVLRNINIATQIWSIFTDEIKSDSYRKHYSDTSLWKKVKGHSKAAGMRVIYLVLLLQYLMKSDTVPTKVKLILSAALGYFILPIDFIPDFAPLLGFSDDLGVLLLILRQMAKHITPEIKQKAHEYLQQLFGNIDHEKIGLLDKNSF